ncbi:hypothetical protein [uncultured Paraglaciecola sp.]|uniref:hypothetical protein n=1 Tax=uncultured Paraglaciecola sp. TaxID=1765024 RepID=UPI00261B63E6|nr:hypothetical protein [uncultured Paraglaciecola sp.]
MKKLTTYALLAATLALATLAQAQDCVPLTETPILACDAGTMNCPIQIRVCFDEPTTRIDGTPLPASEIAGHKLRAATSGGATIVDYAESGTAVPMVLAVTVADVLDDGQVSIALDITTVDIYGNEAAQYSPTNIVNAGFDQAFIDSVGGELSPLSRILNLEAVIVVQ